MALTCMRCRTQNPDGNSFCQACGTPLAAAAAAAPTGPLGQPPGAPPPLMGPPPDLAPPTYQSPYYTPSAGSLQAPVHRTPWVLIVSAVVVLVLVMAGGGTAYAILNARNTNQANSVLPSPSPAGTPSPVQQTSPAAGAADASTSAVSVTLPAGWVASKSDPTVTLTNSAGDGSIVISSGADSPPQTAQQIKDVVDKQLTTQFPDTRTCPNTKTTTGSVGGVAGIWWQLCFTATQGAQSFQGEFSLWAGANSDGSIGYGVILFTLESKMSSFMNEAKPVLASIQWKLK